MNVGVPDWADLLITRLKLDEPQTLGELAERMGAPRRALEKAVERLRLRGAPVVSGPAGICLTRDPEVLLDNYRRLRSRYIHQAQGARELRRTAQRMRAAAYVQTNIWEAS